jgi:hypothetical protein
VGYLGKVPPDDNTETTESKYRADQKVLVPFGLQIVPALITEVRGPFGIGGSFLCRMRLEGTDEVDRADFELREDALEPAEWAHARRARSVEQSPPKAVYRAKLIESSIPAHVQDLSRPSLCPAFAWLHVNHYPVAV